jgi:hypothetical protein
VLHVFLVRFVVLVEARRVRGGGLSAGRGCWSVSAVTWSSCSVRRGRLGSGVEVGFGSFGADAKRGSRFLKRGDTGVCGGAVLVALAAGVGSDEGDFLGCLGLGPVGALLGGGLGLLCPCGVLLRLACSAGGVGDLAFGVLSGLVDVVRAVE